LPALIVPLPSAAGNHQYFNGLEQVEKGIAMMLEQKDINPKRLKADILRLKSESGNMLKKFGESTHRYAASTIAAYLDSL
jgi:UDP-N-acetylglucosamine--N-acetylmuramyl-(pentapeptide) pyrophosphoryl-undecaprenol N-acetylglucosamine transferase